MSTTRGKLLALTTSFIATLVWAQTVAGGTSCAGDCDGSGNVTIDEVIRLVDATLDGGNVTACVAGDIDGSGTITIDEILRAVVSALEGCPEQPPTPTPTPNGSSVCSAGPGDGLPCNGDDDCAPVGVCALAHGICDGDYGDPRACDCAAGTCSIACSNDTDQGVCVGGISTGAMCYPDECAGDGACVATVRLCLSGFFKGGWCLRSDQCDGATCGSTGSVCCGGAFDRRACVDAGDCTNSGDGSTGTCVAAGDTCVHVFTATPTPDGITPPTPAPVAFATRVVAYSADNPRSVAVGDVDGDGIPDLVTANSESDSISVLLGRSGGTFQLSPKSPFSAGGAYPVSVALADLNGDGRLDLVVTNQDSESVSILFGQSDHSFVATPGSPVTVEGAQFAAIADLNADGAPDIAVASSNGVTVLRQQADHTFSPAPGSPFTDAGTDSASSLATADLNGDGLIDLVTANSVDSNGNYCDPGSVSILLQQPDHSFQHAAGSPFGIGFGFVPVAVAVADFNGDGRPDLVTANLGDAENYTSCNCVSVLLQGTDGNFLPAPGSPFSPRGAPDSVAVADINGDGLPDIVTANHDQNSVSVLIEQPNVTFVSAPGSPFPVGSGPQSVAVADLNGDGRWDVVAVNQDSADVSILLGQSDHTLAPAPGSPFTAGPARPMAITLADLNRDFKPDIVTADAASNNLSVLFAQQAGDFSPAPGSPFAVGDIYPHSIAVGDFNADGILDLATANGQSPYFQPSQNVSFLVQQPGHTFIAAPKSPIPLGFMPSAIAAADLNGDGLEDLLAASGGAIGVWLGEPDRSFGPAPGSPFAVGASPSAIVVVDINGDGRPDIVTANQGSNDVSLLLGRPNNGFVAAANSPFAVGGSPEALVVTDVDRDGHLDIVTGNSGSGDVTVLLGAADGSFAPAPGSPFMVGPSPVSIAVTDLNGDYLPDIVAGDSYGDITVAVQQSDHTFVCTPWSPISLETQGHYFSLAVADLNGDRLPDIATASSAGIVVLFQVP